jgi:hypothetical protein
LVGSSRPQPVMTKAATTAAIRMRFIVFPRWIT